MSDSVGKAKRARRAKVIHLRAKGWTIEGIANDLKVFTRTVDRDLQSVDTHAFVDEFIRRQLIDIEGHLTDEAVEARLKGREVLIGRLSPKKDSGTGFKEPSEIVVTYDKTQP